MSFSIDEFIKLKLTAIASRPDLPDGNWIHLEDLESFLIGANVIPHGNGVKTLEEIDEWISACGFSGVEFMGRPVAASTDDPLGHLQVIPATYFRKTRGMYGSQGISRLPGNMQQEAQDAAAREDAAGYPDSDWQEVVINRGSLIPYIKRNSAEVISISTGAPGRPSPMHLVKLEHARRVKENQAFTGRQDEAEYLESWLKEQFPTLPPLTAKTIRNRLADAARAPAKDTARK